MSIANSPEEVTPILKGTKIKNTSLTQMNGKTTSIMDILNNQPAILIFYRGSW